MSTILEIGGYQVLVSDEPENGFFIDMFLRLNAEVSGVGWSEAEAYAVHWNDLLAGSFVLIFHVPVISILHD